MTIKTWNGGIKQVMLVFFKKQAIVGQSKRGIGKMKVDNIANMVIATDNCGGVEGSVFAGWDWSVLHFLRFLRLFR